MADVRVDRVRQLLSSGNTAEASKLLATLIREDSGNADLWYMAAFTTKDNAKRLTAVQRAIAIDPTHAKAHALLQKLQPDDLDALLSSAPVGVPDEVRIARSKSYTNAVVICLVLYFVLWIPGVIANNIYYNEGRRMEELAGHELPGVATLGTMKRVMFLLFIFGIIGWILIFAL